MFGGDFAPEQKVFFFNAYQNMTQSASLTSAFVEDPLLLAVVFDPEGCRGSLGPVADVFQLDQPVDVRDVREAIARRCLDPLGVPAREARSDLPPILPLACPHYSIESPQFLPISTSTFEGRRRGTQSDIS